MEACFTKRYPHFWVFSAFFISLQVTLGRYVSIRLSGYEADFVTVGSTDSDCYRESTIQLRKFALVNSAYKVC